MKDKLENQKLSVKRTATAVVVVGLAISTVWFVRENRALKALLAETGLAVENGLKLVPVTEA